MTATSAQPVATIGDNLPQISAAEALHERLAESFASQTKRRDELLAAAKRAPTAIDDDEAAGKVTDFIKQLAAAVKAAEATRVDEKEPFLESGRTVDGFFKAITEPLKKAKVSITSVLTIYQKRIADAERKAREEIARKAREEAEATAKKAAEAEAKIKDAVDLDNAVEAEAARVQAEAAAAEAKKSADAKAAELSQVRGDYGGHSSLRTSWVHDEGAVDRAALDVEALRDHFPLDALHKAIRSYIKAGGRKLDGVRIYEQTKSVVR